MKQRRSGATDEGEGITEPKARRQKAKRGRSMRDGVERERGISLGIGIT